MKEFIRIGKLKRGRLKRGDELRTYKYPRGTLYLKHDILGYEGRFLCLKWRFSIRLADIESLEIQKEFKDRGIYWRPFSPILDLRGLVGDMPVHLGLLVDDPEGWKSTIDKARTAATSI